VTRRLTKVSGQYAVLFRPRVQGIPLPDYQPITPDKFSKYCWTKTDNYQFTSKDTTCPIVVEELAQVAFNFPCAFVSDSEGFSLVSVQGLDAKNNLCIDTDGNWQADYVPAHYRAHPFALAKASDAQFVVCVDVESQQLNETGIGMPFFGDDGKPSEALNAVINFQKILANAKSTTQKISAALASKALIKSVEYNVGTATETRKIAGLFGIDETALNALPAEDLVELRNAGALGVAYLQLFSTHQFRNLSRLKESGAKNLPKNDLPVGLDLDFLQNHGSIIFGAL
jgi:hypothetical protein